GAIAAANMGFMANAQGLGYCFAQSPTEIFDDPEIRKMYDIPDNKKCVLTLLVGYPEASYFCSVPRKDPEIIWK
ncbi:MAG: nitroreductase family protein, partial [Lachnospiraceae bacterium]|nr:nitroreductase family protein [Lachnospiraceae bacterium]